MEGAKNSNAFNEQHPICCFCGGGAVTETKEHIPSRQYFYGRRRPNQLVVPACKKCNNITGAGEQIVALLVRSLRELTGRGLDHDRIPKIFEGVGRSFPIIFSEWADISLKQRRACRRLEQALGMRIYPINIGSETKKHLYAFAAKLACALNYYEGAGIVSSNSRIFTRIITYAQIANGWSLPEFIRRELGAPKTLKQGKEGVEDQFQWASLYEK